MLVEHDLVADVPQLLKQNLWLQEIPNGIAAWAGTMVVPQQVLSRCGVRNTCVLGQHEKMERHDPCVHRSATGASSIYLGRWLPIQWAIWEAHCCSYWPCLGSPDVQCRMLLAAILPQRGSSISLLVGIYIYIILFSVIYFWLVPKTFLFGYLCASHRFFWCEVLSTGFPTLYAFLEPVTCQKSCHISS